MATQNLPQIAPTMQPQAQGLTTLRAVLKRLKLFEAAFPHNAKDCYQLIEQVKADMATAFAEFMGVTQ